MDKNLTSAHVEISYWIQKKNIKALKHTPKINADILKDINTTVV